MDATAPAAAAARLPWVDTARGLAILLVVLMHADDWLATAGLGSPRWATFDDVAGGLRMPLFFAVAGCLGAGWATRPAVDLVSRKLLALVWVYLLWQPVDLLGSVIADRFTGGSSSPGHLLLALAATVVRPRSELWFLWALAAYFVIWRATARTPRALQFTVAATLASIWLSELGPAGNLGWNGVPRYYLFFLIGAHHRAALGRWTAWCRRRPAAAALVLLAWAVPATATVLSGHDHSFGAGLVLRLSGLAAGLALAAVLPPARLWHHLGARTLPVYLAHTTLVVVAVWALTRLPAHLRPPGGVLPVLVVAVVTPVALALPPVAQRLGAGWLYHPPDGARRLVAGLVSARLGHPPAVRHPDGSTGADGVHPEPDLVRRPAVGAGGGHHPPAAGTGPVEPVQPVGTAAPVVASGGTQPAHVVRVDDEADLRPASTHRAHPWGDGGLGHEDPARQGRRALLGGRVEQVGLGGAQLLGQSRGTSTAEQARHAGHPHPTVGHGQGPDRAPPREEISAPVSALPTTSGSEQA